MLLASQVSIEPISLVGGILNIGSLLDTIWLQSLQWFYKHVKCGSKRFHNYLREKAVKLTVHVADDERVLRKALILAESLGQGKASALAQPLKTIIVSSSDVFIKHMMCNGTWVKGP